MTIPETVTFISSGVFEGCNSLTEMVIPNAVSFIATYLFEECTSLESITIGNSIESIGALAFYNCKNLRKFVCYTKVPPNVLLDAFEGIIFDECTLFVPKGSVDAYRNASQWALFKNIEELDPIWGDITEDGKVDIADVNRLINSLLYSGNEDWYDLNGDSQVDIADVNVVINAMLGK